MIRILYNRRQNVRELIFIGWFLIVVYIGYLILCNKFKRCFLVKVCDIEIGDVQI